MLCAYLSSNSEVSNRRKNYYYPHRVTAIYNAIEDFVCFFDDNIFHFKRQKKSYLNVRRTSCSQKTHLF